MFFFSILFHSWWNRTEEHRNMKQARFENLVKHARHQILPQKKKVCLPETRNSGRKDRIHVQAHLFHALRITPRQKPPCDWLGMLQVWHADQYGVQWSAGSWAVFAVPRGLVMDCKCTGVASATWLGRACFHSTTDYLLSPPTRVSNRRFFLKGSIGSGFRRQNRTQANKQREWRFGLKTVLPRRHIITQTEVHTVGSKSRWSMIKMVAEVQNVSLIQTAAGFRTGHVHIAGA